MKLTGIDHVALHVDDVKAAADFYVDILGFERVHESPGTEGKPIAYVRLPGGSMIELTTRPGGEPMSGFHLGLDCDDIQGMTEALRRRGLVVLTEPKPTTPRGAHQTGWKRAVFRGPHGETIEIKGP